MVWMAFGRPYPPVRDDIVTPRYLFSFNDLYSLQNRTFLSNISHLFNHFYHALAFCLGEERNLLLRRDPIFAHVASSYQNDPRVIEFPTFLNSFQLHSIKQTLYIVIPPLKASVKRKKKPPRHKQNTRMNSQWTKYCKCLYHTVTFDPLFGNE